MLVERIVGLQSGNERDCNNIIATVINHGHLVLEISDVEFEGLSWRRLDGEEVVDFHFKFMSRGVLVEEGIANLLKTSVRS